jgi:hypothetical protein
MEEVELRMLGGLHLLRVEGRPEQTMEHGGHWPGFKHASAFVTTPWRSPMIVGGKLRTINRSGLMGEAGLW